MVDSPVAVTDAPTRQAVELTAARLEAMGHKVTPAVLPFGEEFSRDFTLYWGYIAFLIAATGKLMLDPGFQARRLDGLTTGLRRTFHREFRKTPGVLRRLRRAEAAYAGLFRDHDVILSPVLAHVAPPIGHLSPNVAFEELIQRLHRYVAFTPVNNVTGSPAISLPAEPAGNGLPIGVHLSAAHGQERLLLELAFALEADRPWRRIQD